ncbi:hypothetical protein ACJ73_01165 [Blastomyces percursus]|uniref:Uncharacterized protein n=1 Tax=Blastomyces percursus TaxID=1658174 RepID=A0A1J9RIJ1_9EURO|nr:hypothetical protein ACJ73_01165 [Blastomyces percursus]
MIDIKDRITELTKKIDKRPQDHGDLVYERTKLYDKAAKKRRAKLHEFIEQWWKSSYSEYVTGNGFTERDPTCLFDIYRKYMPQRSRPRDNLFTEASIHSDIGRQCLQDMVSLSVSEKGVAYYPGESLVNGQCPTAQAYLAVPKERDECRTLSTTVQNHFSDFVTYVPIGSTMKQTGGATAFLTSIT